MSSVMPITNHGQQLGFAILLHDLSYIERREAQARTFLLIAFGFLAVMAFGVPMFVAKWARYGWSPELRRLLRGGRQAEPRVPTDSQRYARTGWAAWRTIEKTHPANGPRNA